VCQTGQWQQPGYAADDRKDLKRKRERQARGKQLAERLPTLQRDPQPAATIKP
jgi:hypothetical protein